MKNLGILIITCFIINGCGLFKNTRKDLVIDMSSLSNEKSLESDLKVTDKSTLNEVTTGVSSEVNVNG